MTLKTSKSFPNIGALSPEALKNVKECEDEHVSPFFGIILSPLQSSGNSEEEEIPRGPTNPPATQIGSGSTWWWDFCFKEGEAAPLFSDRLETLSLEHSVLGLGTHSFSNSDHKCAFEMFCGP